MHCGSASTALNQRNVLVQIFAALVSRNFPGFCLKQLLEDKVDAGSCLRHGHARFEPSHDLQPHDLSFASNLRW